MALQLEKTCVHPSLGYMVHGTARVLLLQYAPGHGWHEAGICMSASIPGTGAPA